MLDVKFHLPTLEVESKFEINCKLEFQLYYLEFSTDKKFLIQSRIG
jgi:hypothetical protein